MKKHLVFILLLLIACSESKLDKLESLSLEYATEGRSDSIKTEILSLIVECDSLYNSDIQYLKIKRDVYVNFNDYKTARIIASQISRNNLSRYDELFNRLQDLIIEGKSEGAIELISKLEETNQSFFEIWIHDSYAIIFATENDSLMANNYKILEEIRKSNNINLLESTAGLNIWANVINTSEPDAQVDLALSGDWGNNIRNPRYLFLVAKRLLEHKGYEKHADSLVNRAMTKSYQELELISENPTNKEEIFKRALLRYYISYGSFLKYQMSKKLNNSAELLNNLAKIQFEYLKTASDYSSDQIDIKVKHAYLYDAHILNGEEEYRTTYLEFLMENNLFEEALNEAIQIVINEPAKLNNAFEIIQHVEDSYPELTSNKSFENYLSNNFHNMLPKAIDFNLESLNEELVSLSKYRGKWILLDFWGTWCRPCIEELPKLEQFYISYCIEEDSNIKMITLAQDKVEAVKKYLSKHKFTFPVVMSNNKIKKNFRVIGFPTKILITPNGYYFNIVDRDNFEDIVKDYMKLQIYL